MYSWTTFSKVQRLMKYPVLLRQLIASWSLALVFSTFTSVQIDNFENVPFLQHFIKYLTFWQIFLFKKETFWKLLTCIQNYNIISISSKISLHQMLGIMISLEIETIQDIIIQS